MSRWAGGKLPVAFAAAAANASILLGSILFLSRHLEIRDLKFVIAGMGGMTGATALCFVLVGYGLRRSLKGPPRGYRAFLAKAGLVAVLALALMAIAEHQFGVDLWLAGVLNGEGNEDYFLNRPDVPGRIAFLAAITLLLASVSLLFRDDVRTVFRMPVPVTELILVVALGICYLHLVNYNFPVPIRKQMPSQTAFLLTFLCLGILFARPHQGLMRVITSATQGGLLSRRLLPAVLLLPLGLSWIRSQEIVSQLYGPTVGLSLTVAAAAFLLAALVWLTALSLDHADTARAEAEEALRRVNAELEDRVAARTAELTEVNEGLRSALQRIRTLSGLLPICAWCKRIRDDHGYWTQVEHYVRDHSDAEFTHGICPECAEKVR